MATHTKFHDPRARGPRRVTRGVHCRRLDIETLEVRRLLSFSPDQGVVTSTNPMELTGAALSTVSATVGRDQTLYHGSATPAGVSFANPTNGFTATLQSDSLKFMHGADTWEMSLLAVGHDGSMLSVGAAQVALDGNRVDLSYGAVDEWYVNGPMGLEQGFTISPTPNTASGGPLTVDLALGGNLRATTNPTGNGLTLSRPDGTSSLAYSGLVAYDATGKALPAWLELRPDGSRQDLLIHVDDTGAHGRIVIDPFVQEAKLTTSDGEANSSFGGAVAVSGNTIVVGAFNASGGFSSQQGAVYVFTAPATGWADMTETARLTASDGAFGDAFGSAVSMSGSTIVVGAPYASVGGLGSRGAVYVFTKPATGWATMTETAKLTASDGAARDLFGSAVDLSGTTLVVGAPDAKVGKNREQGAAYVFTEPGTGWASETETAKLTASDGTQVNLFGSSVALSGTTIVVGAPKALGPIGVQGAAYVFVEPATGWSTRTQTARLTAASLNVAGYGFGNKVAISGKMIAVGAPFATTGGNTNQGAAYVFTEPAIGWSDMTQTATLTASDGKASDYLGLSIAVSGTTVAVGATQFVTGAGANTTTGAVYLFTQPSGGWSDMSQTSKLTASDAAVGDQFGYSVGYDGTTLAAGAREAGGGKGAVYLFGTQPANLVKWTLAGSGNWNTGANWSTGKVPGPGDDVVINTAAAATITIRPGDLESVHSLTTAATDALAIAGGSLTLAASSTLGGALAITTGARLTATGTGVIVQAGGPTTVSDSNLFATGGATLSLPNLLSGTEDGTSTNTFDAIGLGSTLALAGLDGLAVTSGALLTIEAQAGASVMLPALTGINTGPVSLVSDGTGSVLDTSNLAAFSAASGSLKNSLLQASDSGTVKVAAGLTSLTGVDLSLDANESAFAGGIKTYTGGTLTLNGGTFNLSALTNLSSANVIVQNTNLTLPPSGSYVAAGSSVTVAAGTLGAGGRQFTIMASNDAPTLNIPSLSAGLTLVIPGDVFTGATFNVPPNDHISLTGGHYDGGTFNVAQGATVDLTGGQSLVYFGGTLSGSGAGTLLLASGGLNVATGGLTLNFPSGMFQWTGGNIFGILGDVTNKGSLNIDFAGTGGIFEDATLDNFGTIFQTGSSNLGLRGHNGTPTSLQNEAGATYQIGSDSGIDNPFGGPSALINAGTILKTAGTGVSTVLVNGALSNKGTIAAESGKLQLAASTVVQVSGNALTDGTWQALSGAQLRLPAGTAVTTSAADLTISGSGASIGGISDLALNTGRLRLANGATFSTAGDFTNSGTLTLGPAATLNVAGSFTQGATGTWVEQVAGSADSGQFGQIIATKVANLAGSLQVQILKNFSRAGGANFPIASFARSSVNFTLVTGLSPIFTESVDPTHLNLVIGSGPVVDLAATSATAPTAAVAGQDVTVAWHVINQASEAATGNWQDAVYLSPTPTITGTSTLLGKVIHTGGLGAGVAYDASLTTALPALPPRKYYVLVQVDNLDGVADSNRLNNTLLAGTGTLAVSLPTLTLGTPYADAFTAGGQDRYYQINATAGGSIQLTLAGSPASEKNAIFVGFNQFPSTYSADFQSPTTSPDPILVVPTAFGGTYYIQVHNQSGDPGPFTLTASRPSLGLLGATPGVVGNGGQATLKVKGLELGTDTTYTLVGPSGTIAAIQVENIDAALAYVTFNLQGVAAGTYDLRATSGGKVTTLPGAVQVKSGGGPQVVASFLANSPVRSGRTSVFYVQYENIGNDDALAPLLTVTSPLNIPMSFDGSSSPTALTLQVMGLNEVGPAGVLPPGAKNRFAVYYNPYTGTRFQFNVSVTTGSESTALTEPSFWQNNVQSVIPIDVASAANWPAVEARLQAMVGSTWGSYVGLLDREAALLPLSSGNPSSPAELVQLALQQAQAAVQTSISGLAVGTGPGVLLAGNKVTATNATTGDIFRATVLNDGSFVFPTVTPGSYTLSVADALLHGPSTPITVGTGQSLTGVKLTLDPEAILIGQITASADGSPVAGASVFLISSGGNKFSVISDTSGNYGTALAPGDYTVVVVAQGLARTYTTVSLAASPSSLNVSLDVQSKASATVTLSDGKTADGIDVVAALHGASALPTFSGTFTGNSFLLDSLDAGTYDITISVFSYNSVTLSNVVIGPGQTLDLGTVPLTPNDPEASVTFLALKATAQLSVASYFLIGGAGDSAKQVVGEYFNGPGISTINSVGPVSYNYTPSTDVNPSVTITGSDLASFRTNSTTRTALETTLQKIGSELEKVPSTLPQLQGVLDSFKTSGCNASPVAITWDVAELMPALKLGSWMDVTLNKYGESSYGPSPEVVRQMWEWGNGTSADGGVAANLAGGVGLGGAPPAYATNSDDDRVLSGKVTLVINPNGTSNLIGTFTVTVHDTFDFKPAGLGPIVRTDNAYNSNIRQIDNDEAHGVNPALGQVLGQVKRVLNDVGTAITLPFSFATAGAVLGLAVLEHLDLTSDVPIVAKFDAPFVSTTIRFKTGMPNCNVPAGPVVSVSGTVVQSQDPNALSGPLGYGTPRFVAPVGVLPYFVSFENDGSTAAQTVSVTEQLDPNLDWSTFQLGDFGFGPIHVSVPAGLAQYQTSVSYQNSDGSPLNVHVALKFNVQTGRLTADFTSVDPTTGQAPRGVFDGFLLPNDATHVGEGYIQYSARPKAGLSTGTQIRGTASITFDQNSPIATDQVDPHDPSKGTDPSKEAPVTIDSEAPSSHVLTLPAVQAGLGFPVGWNGTDDVGGSGIASYTVYVSDNGGAFTPWLVNTSETSATYTGKSGHLYSFYSVATDHVGNTELKPAAAEASTSVPSQATTFTSVTSDHAAGSSYGQVVTFTATVSAAGSGTPIGSVMFVLDGAEWGSPVTLVNGSAKSPGIANLGAGSHNVSAAYSGGSAFLPSTAPAFTQAVAPAILTVKANDRARLYGQGNPRITFSVSGFVNGDTGAVLTTKPLLSSTATPASHAGSYPIVATGARAANYAITYVNGSLNVSPAPLTVTANDQTIMQGNNLPTFTASYSGFVNGDGPASLSSPVKLVTAATSSSQPGRYTITPSGARSSDYAITYHPGTLSINPTGSGYGAVRDAFVTTLYREILGRAPERDGLVGWSRLLSTGVQPIAVAQAIWDSKEHRNLFRQGRAPAIPFAAAYRDALTAASLLTTRSQKTPSGPLSLRQLN